MHNAIDKTKENHMTMTQWLQSMNLKLVKTVGSINFYQDDKGNTYQNQVGSNEFRKV